MNNMIHGLLNIPMNKLNYNKELNVTLQITHNNECNSKTVYKILKKGKNTQTK